MVQSHSGAATGTGSRRQITRSMCSPGFCIELIDRLAKLLQFNYTFVEQEDGDYGSKDNVTNKWSGMLGRLMEDEVSMSPPAAVWQGDSVAG